MKSGIAILTASRGKAMMVSPFKENIMTIVNNKANKVNGEILGKNLFSYHSFPLTFKPMKRVNIPATKGMPRYIMTLFVISHIDITTDRFSMPNTPGNTFKKK